MYPMSILNMSPTAFQVMKASWMFIPGVVFTIVVVMTGFPIASIVVTVTGWAKNRLAKSVSKKYSNTPNSVPPTSRRVRRM